MNPQQDWRIKLDKKLCQKLLPLMYGFNYRKRHFSLKWYLV